MMNCVPDKKVFRWGYGSIFTILQIILGFGFLFMLVVVLNPFVDPQLSVSPAIDAITSSYVMVSFLGFPLVSSMKFGQYQLIRKSKLTLSAEGCHYTAQATMLWTLVGRVCVVIEYDITEISNVVQTKRYFIVSGRVNRTKYNNGRVEESGAVAQVKIPKAFAGLEMITNYGS